MEIMIVLKNYLLNKLHKKEKHMKNNRKCLNKHNNKKVKNKTKKKK